MIRWLRSLNEKWVLINTVSVVGSGESRLFGQEWDFKSKVYFYEKPKTKYRKIEVVGQFSREIKQRASNSYSNWLNGIADELVEGNF